MRAAVAFAVCAAAACGPDAAGGDRTAGAAIDVPPRAATAGDELLALVPAGAAAIAEIDIARLRANEVIGAAVSSLGAVDVGAPELGVGFNVVGAADAVVLASYAVGGDDASTLTLLRGPGVAALDAGLVVAPDTRAIGPEHLVARAAELGAGTGASVAGDAGLLRVRTHAMPEKADGAALRVAALLDFEARVELASRFELDAVPVSVSIWGDVADDLAVVGMMAAATADEAVDLVASLNGWRVRVIEQPWARAAGLSYILDAVTIERRAQSARAVLLIGPRHLHQLMNRLGFAPGDDEEH